MSGPASVAVLGGAFDPPHIGHMTMALYALSLGWEQVRVIPVGNHPFAKEMSSFGHRLTMTRMAFAGIKGVVVDSREGSRSGPSRTVDTLMQLRSELPKARLGLVIGEDNLMSVHKWHAWDRIEKMCEIVVVGRGTDSSLPFALPDINSSALRTLMAQGQDISGLVPAAVAEYAARHGLYEGVGSNGVSWGLVGAGRVGLSLAVSLARKGFAPTWIHDPVSIEKHNYFKYLDGLEKGEHVDVVVMAVPDSVAADVAARIYRHHPDSAIVTVGAARPLDEVFASVPQDAKTGMAHPLRAFPDVRPVDSPLFMTLSGHPEAATAARRLFAPVVLRFFEIPTRQVSLYHALAALAANGTAFLASGVSRALTSFAGSREVASSAVVDLMLSSVRAMARLGIASGTTGPAARGDHKALEHHRKALSGNPALLEAYDALLELFRHAS